MSKKNTLPVLVTGAGPVGLALAVELHRYGIPLRIIDRRAARSVHSKAIGIHARTLEVFAAMGVIDKFLQAGQKITRIDLHTQSKRLVQIHLGEMTDTPYPFALNLPQSETEQILEQHLAERGILVERNCELVALAQGPRQAQALVRHLGGREEKIEADFIIGCDGVHSTVRQQAGLAFEGTDLKQVFALADVTFATTFDREAWTLFFHPAGFFLLFPLKNDRWRVVVNLEADPQRSLTVADLHDLAERRGVPHPAISEVLWTSTFTTHSRKAPSYQNGRILIAGDAAHVHSPVGAQGMNTGIQDAFNLAWKIAYVHSQLAPIDLLDSYNEEREKIGRDILTRTERATRVATLRNPLYLRLRNALLPVLGNLGYVQEKALNTLEEMTIHYRGSTLSDQHLGKGPSPVTLNIFREESPRAGDRAPDGTLVHAISGEAQRLHPLFSQGKLTLLIFLPAAADSHSCEDPESQQVLHLLSALKNWNQRIVKPLVISGRHLPQEWSTHIDDAYLDARATVRKHYGVKRSSAAYLIRPDGYIGFRSLPARSDPIELYLQTHYL